MSIPVMIEQLAISFGNTALIFFITLIGSLPLGLVVYFCKKSKVKVLHWFTEIYISIMRGTPLMLQLMVVYFVPGLVLGVSVPSNWRMTATMLAFIINYAAYWAEIYRGGIESIPVGQYEAAQVLGYSKSQTFFKIILPQMVKRIIPPTTNEVITLVKDTSLASTLGVIEMFTKAKQIAVAPQSPGMLTFVVAAVFYYIFNTVVSYAMKRFEKALSYYR